MRACGNTPPINIKSACFFHPPCSYLHIPSLSILCLSILSHRYNFTVTILIRLAPDKDKWIANERNRWRKEFNVPMKPDVPEGFPPLTLLVMRALCVVDEVHGQEVFIKVLDEVLKAFWVEHRKVWEREALVEVLSAVLGGEEAGSG